MDKGIEHKGSCLCGAIQFKAIGKPLRTAFCHCPSCRKANGAAFAGFVDFKRDQVTFSGQPIKEYQSSESAIRTFCGECGSSIAYKGLNWSDEIHMHIGCFDNPDATPMQDHVYMKGKISFIHLKDGLPTYEEFPKRVIAK